MDDQPPRNVNTNAYVGTSSDPGINVGTSINVGIGTNNNMAMVTQPPQEQGVGIGTNNNMAMVTQPPQEQGVTYGYGYAYYYGYQYGYPQQYPPRYENAGYPEEPSIYVPPPLNLVVNQGHYGHPGTYQFQPSTSQPQHHSYHHQELQFQQPQPQRSDTGSRSGPLVLRNDYNLPGFVTRYANAKFFVIKSWNKEHVLHSIRYRVWTSTWRGNLKLNAAYAEAISSEQSVQGGSSRASRSNCPIFLLFSVNTSGHFCGVAEMVGPVDFGAKAEFWDWVGIFPVKWHIIKDVPFKKVFHIIVESNENRSIVFSRDVQQVEKEKGEEMLCRFKKHVSTTSLLDEIALPGQRRPASATHNEDQEREVQHERQRKHQVQEEDDNTQQETDHKNEQEKQETNHNNAQEIEGGESQDNGHTSNNKNKIQEEETDHSDSREDDCGENQQIDSIVITVTCSNIKEEKIDHNNARESERGENNRTESNVIKLISHRSSNNDNKQEDKTDTNKQEEETDGKIKREPLCLENQEKDSTVIRVTSHSSNYNNNAQ